MVWAAGFESIEPWGVEGGSGLDRPLVEYLIEAGCDVRDVPPPKTPARQRDRHEGKGDRLDSHRVAAEARAKVRLARAFKHARSARPDSIRERLALWHNARKSLTKIRIQLLGELGSSSTACPRTSGSSFRPCTRSAHV